MTIKITYAGYGCYDKIANVTAKINEAYNGDNTRKFLASNALAPDPYPGARKYLYVVWENEDGVEYSGVVGEGDNTGIELPDPTPA